jgi:hypothetical protein
MGKLAETDKRCLKSLSHSFTLDFCIGCELETDARQIMAVLPKRCARLGLTMHPEKTVLIAFGKPAARRASAHGNGPLDFLGLTHYSVHLNKSTKSAVGVVMSLRPRDQGPMRRGLPRRGPRSTGDRRPE